MPQPKHSTPYNPEIAVIGGGLCGLTCAGELSRRGLSVTVFDKGRSPGGRMSTRRTEEGLMFDHGCQYFAARDARFRKQVEVWRKEGVVDEWQGRLITMDDGVSNVDLPRHPRFVGVPKMSAICRHVASELSVKHQVLVDAVQRHGESWRVLLADGRSLGDFDCVIVAVPAVQAVDLLESAPQLAARAVDATMNACWTTMVAFQDRLAFPADGIRFKNSPLGWACRNSSKPGREPEPDCWVLQASADWSAMQLEKSPEEVSESMLSMLQSELACELPRAGHLQAHRWRYAVPAKPENFGCLIDLETRIGVCGDWCSGNRVEAAFLSGSRMADRVFAFYRGEVCDLLTDQ